MDNQLDEKQIEELKKDLHTNGPASASAKAQLYSQDDTPLNIGVTGESGSGKSSFINAFRGVADGDENAAPVGYYRNHHDVYTLPPSNIPSVTLWDLPGIGTTKFPADKYLKAVGLEKFDFFIIISADRFRENDAKLAQEIQRMGKRFYFVRSKIDHNMRDEKSRLKSKFNEERALEQIRKNCNKGLEELGVESQRVFLVSSRKLQLYDFSLLAEALEKQLPVHQRSVLLLAMPNVNPVIIRKKKNALKSKIKYLATISAFVAAAPIPGLSIAADVALLLLTAKHYQDIFGLDIKSLQNLAYSAHVELKDLRAVMTSPLATQKLSKGVVIKMLSTCSATAALMAAEEGSHFIPLIGIPIAMGLSFTVTYKTLHAILNMFAEDAESVSIKILGFNTAV